MFFFQRFVKNHLKTKSLFSFILLPFSILYSFILLIRRKIYKRYLSVYKSDTMILSVGNIVSGGVGKTPFVIYIAKFLKSNSKRVAISHRGYKGNFEDKVTLISDYEQVFSNAKDAGDESYMLAKILSGIPVICGKNRKLAIKVLEKSFPDLDYIILDDSFQHLSIEHFVDFVIISQYSPFGNGFVLPAGILREPISALKDADIIVWNGDKEPDKLLKKFQKPIIKFHYIIKGIYKEDNSLFKDKDLQKYNFIFLSAIGNPDSFEMLIKKYYPDLTYYIHYKLPDHYNYPDIFIKKLKRVIENRNIDFVLTTEKDFTKLKGKNLPLLIVKIEATIENDNVLKELLL